jgi:hypothetical protein
VALQWTMMLDGSARALPDVDNIGVDGQLIGDGGGRAPATSGGCRGIVRWTGEGQRRHTG